MRPTREDLLGYLLGALETDERTRVEEELRQDPQLARELDELREQLEILDQGGEVFEPPSGLAASTCDFVFSQVEALRDESLYEHVCDSAPPASPQATPAARRGAGERGALLPRTGSWKLSDLIVGTGVFLAAALLFFPAIANSRYAARLAGCQENLRHLGFALTKYSEHHGGSFPYVPVFGNRSFAGVYAPLLHDYQLIEPRYVICPSSRFAEQIESWYLPTMEEIDLASGPTLQKYREESGASYGYNLGVIVNGRHMAVRNLGRSHFVLMTDSPSYFLPQRQSANHGGLSHNVLYEDGHIENVVGCLAEQCSDDPLLNRYGHLEAGVDENDAVVGSSSIRPLHHGP